ncbi:MAG TPA: hypothetical protein VJN18_00380 [Polyangiaceae bacterium]|nr:hypothetical protein [Polyangiaceae bacterium]
MFPTLINNPRPEQMSELAERLAGGEALLVQFADAIYTPEQLQQLDELCATHRAQLHVRFYAHYGSIFDASILRALPHVVTLKLDCLQHANHVDTIAELPHLEHLGIDIFELADTQILRFENLRALRSLFVGDTRRSRLDLSYVSTFAQLDSLRISGQTLGLQAIADLPALRALTLRSIPKSSALGFVSKIASLRSLDVVLGGRSDVHEVQSTNLRDLELIRIRGLSDLGDLARFPNLVSLVLEDQIQVRAVHLTPANATCQSLRIFNCKNLSTLSGLNHLTQLRHLRIGTTPLDIDSLLATLPPTLETCGIYTGKERENRRIRELLDARGIREFDAGTQ